nr:IS30 transposase [Streptomyces sp.]
MGVECGDPAYQAPYSQARGGLRREVQAAVRSGRTRREPRRDPERRTHRFTDPMVMISDRPAAVENRAVPGHWEGDLIIGAGGRSAIATPVERSTRYTSLHGLEDLERVAQELNGRPRKTLGWDTPAERLRDLLTTWNRAVLRRPLEPKHGGARVTVRGVRNLRTSEVGRPGAHGGPEGAAWRRRRSPADRDLNSLFRRWS